MYAWFRRKSVRFGCDGFCGVLVCFVGVVEPVDTEFDFISANARLEKEKLESEMFKDAESKSESASSFAPGYDATVDFFDNLELSILRLNLYIGITSCFVLIFLIGLFLFFSTLYVHSFLSEEVKFFFIYLIYFS